MNQASEENNGDRKGRQEGIFRVPEPFKHSNEVNHGESQKEKEWNCSDQSHALDNCQIAASMLMGRHYVGRKVAYVIGNRVIFRGGRTKTATQQRMFLDRRNRSIPDRSTRT